MNRKILCALFAFLLCFSTLVACTGGSGTKNTTDDTSASGETKDIEDNLPPLDFGKEKVTIYYGVYDPNFNNQIWEMEGDASGEYISRAVYDRNIKVEQRLNVDLDFYNCGAVMEKYAEYANNIAKLINAGENTFDIYYNRAANAVAASVQNIFINMIDAPYIDYEKPWWYTEQMDSISLNSDSRYVLMGDLLVSNYSNMTAVFFNKKIYEDKLGNPNDLYKLVKDGKWTYDKLHEYCETVYADLNGDGLANIGDVFGIHYELNSSRTGTYYPYTSGITLTTRDQYGFPQLNYNNEKTVGMVEKLYKLLYQNRGAFAMTYAEAASAFTTDQLLFFTFFLSWGNNFRDMESDYGIIPFPKYDESLDYTTAILTGAGVLVVPITLEDSRMEMVCAVLEALCVENSRSVVDYYYESVMKTRNVRESIDAEMIDLIRTSLKFDITFWMGASIGNIQNFFKSFVIDKKSKDFSSEWAIKESYYKTQLDKLIDSYIEAH